MRENQVTPTRTGKRRHARPLTVSEALLHLRQRAALMRTKPQRVWLRWNQADAEAVDVLLHAVNRKIASND